MTPHLNISNRPTITEVALSAGSRAHCVRARLLRTPSAGAPARRGRRTAAICGDGPQTGEFVSVGDVVDEFMIAGRSDARGALNVATGRETTLSELAQALGLAHAVRAGAA